VSASEVLVRCAEDPHTFLFWCEGCAAYHEVWSSKTTRRKSGWEFNGDMYAPTFSPSYLSGLPDDKGNGFSKYRCHLYIKDGYLQYLPDCHHGYAGMSIPMRPADFN